MEAKLKNDTDIAMSKRDFELKKATYDTEVNTAKAEAEMAYALQAAKVQARIKEEEMQVKVVERSVNFFPDWLIETATFVEASLFKFWDFFICGETQNYFFPFGLNLIVNIILNYFQAAEHCYPGAGNHEEREGAG